jgi:hypothetical protein
MQDLINFMIQEWVSAFKMNFPTFSNNGKNKNWKTQEVFSSFWFIQSSDEGHYSLMVASRRSKML